MIKFYKRITLLSIKYGPSILALTCCIKIFLLTYSTEKNVFEQSVNYINLFLNLTILGVIYCEGRYFNYCWKHKSLCRVALWGYLFYLDFLLFSPPYKEIRAITIFYLISTICITVWYRNG